MGYPSVYTLTYPVSYTAAMPDSLVIGEQFELIGPGGSTLDPNGTPSLNPLLGQTVFRLIAPTAARGGVTWDLGAPQPTTDIVGSLLLDGERPFGYRASNRTITLPIIIKAPTFQQLITAREVLLQEVNQQTFTLRWTRDTTKATAGNTVPLPLLFDCFRAQPTVYEWGGFYHRIPYGVITLTFQALPYARSDQPVILDFPQALAGRPTPPPAVNLDTFASVSGAQWAANAQSPVPGGQSAYWDPSISPANDPTGTGLAAQYSGSGLAVDLIEGWTAVQQNNSLSNSEATVTTAQAASMEVGDQFQICANALTGQNAGFEGGLGGWTALANTTVTDSATQAHSGSDSMRMSSTAAGDMTAQSATGTGGLRILGGDTVFASAWFRSAVSGRTCAVGAAFYDALGTFISSSYTGFLGSTPTDTTTGWVQATAQLGAPTGAAFYAVLVKVEATGGASELHYVDDVDATSRDSVPLQSTIFTLTSISPPSSGFVNLFFNPNAASPPATGNILVQTGANTAYRHQTVISALTFWAGFGSTNYYKQWARLGGRVTFAFTLTDAYSNQVSFHKTMTCTGSNDSGAPKWHKVRAPFPVAPNFAWNQVASYSLTVTNRAPVGAPSLPGVAQLQYSQLYISALQGVPAPSTVVPAQRGVVYDLAGVPGSARAPFSLQLQQVGTANVGRFYTRPGTYFWTCPVGVSSVSVVAIGAGGQGGAGAGGSAGGGGGGGGGSAANNSVGVTPGVRYKIVVGQGGYWVVGGFGEQVAATGSSFAGDSVTVTANPGTGGNQTSNAAGTGGAAGVGGFAGGSGGTGDNAAGGGGGGGGGSGGSAANGNAGTASTSGTGGAGGAAVTFGGAGGKGGTFGHGNGSTGGFGGGSGGSPQGATGYLPPGGNGLVSLNYNIPKPFQSLVVHRPPPAAPESLSPVQPVSVTDPSDGSVSYTLTPIGTGAQARFGGTYSIAVVAYSWASPASARAITVTVTQFEQQGGASYTATASQTITPNSLPALSGTNAGHGPIVLLGELTLPIQDLPPDNLDCYFTVSITSGQTADAFSDILFLDTQGSTVIIESPTSYSNMYIDEPPVDRDLGYIMGSVFDRADAVSILDRAFVSGGPLSITPDGNPYLLVYCAEGSPQAQAHYFPRWWLDRYA